MADEEPKFEDVGVASLNIPDVTGAAGAEVPNPVSALNVNRVGVFVLIELGAKSNLAPGEGGGKSNLFRRDVGVNGGDNGETGILGVLGVCGDKGTSASSQNDAPGRVSGFGEELLRLRKKGRFFNDFVTDIEELDLGWMDMAEIAEQM